MRIGNQDPHVGVLVELDRKVPRHVRAAVVVPVVLHEVVHVVEDQTVPVQVLHRLLVAHVEQHGSIERLCAPLWIKRHTLYFLFLHVRVQTTVIHIKRLVPVKQTAYE